MSCHICNCHKPPPDCPLCSDYSYSKELVPHLKIVSAPPMREYRGLTRVNEANTVDWYTERGVLYPDVLISTRLPTTWFGRLFMNRDQKNLEAALTRNRMTCTEWPR
jgi:hypothetical protein